MGNKNGFLLMELLVSLAVLAIVALPLLSMFVVSSDTLQFSRRQTTAAFLVQEAVEELKSEGFDLAQSITEEEVVGYPGYFRRVEVEDFETAYGEEVKHVTVFVVWHSKGGRQEVDLSTYLARR